jgi:hypothetical protein
MKQVIFAAAAILALGAGSASAVPVAAHQGKVVAPPISVKRHVICANAQTDSGIALASETFTDFSGYDSSGAADCRIRAAAIITEIDTVGQYFNGSGPANSVDVTIYKNSAGKPGRVVAAYTGLSYTDSTGFGSFEVKIKRTILTRGTYWIAVQPSMTFGTEGQWGWELQNETHGAADQWEEQGGLGTGCTTWDLPVNCTGYGNDFMFTARGVGI